MAKKKNSEVLLADNETGELLNVDEGIEIQYTKQYGVGCDCHARFLQISVLVKHDDIAFIILLPFSAIFGKHKAIFPNIYVEIFSRINHIAARI